MSRFGPNARGFFQSVYDTAAPWDIGESQPAMAALLGRHPPRDPVLDLGCGTGDLAIHLARLGHDVLGVDFIETAVDLANRKRDALPAAIARRLSFHVADALQPSSLGLRFGSVLDSGFLHLFDEDETNRLVQEVASVLVAGGRYYLHEFAVTFPAEHVPRAVTEDEVRAHFTEASGWRILEVAPAVFHSTVAPPVAAIVACVERR